MNWSIGALLATSTAAERVVRRPARPARCQVAAIVPGYPASTETSSAPMSMPSSRALVETTARTSPSRKTALDLTTTVRQVAAAISADDVRGTRRPVKGVLQIRRQDLDRETALGEDDQLQVVLEELERDPARFGEIRTADAELRVDDRRVHEEEELLAARRAALLHQLEWTARSDLQRARAGSRSSPRSR